MATKSTKSGEKSALTAKNSESSRHLKTSKPKSSAAPKSAKPAVKK
jgi:hypothetical protein